MAQLFHFVRSVASTVSLLLAACAQMIVLDIMAVSSFRISVLALLVFADGIGAAGNNDLDRDSYCE